MFARELISSLIPALHPLDTVAKALQLMNEYHSSHLPLVAEENYLGLIDEEELLSRDNPDDLLENTRYEYFKPAVQEAAHFFEALKLSSEFKLTVVPVINDEGKYCGAITLQSLLEAVSRFNSLHEPGGMLLLEIRVQDYSLAEIARIAESNDVNILSVNTSLDLLTSKVMVLIKTNRLDLQPLISTFQRFNYTISYLFAEVHEEDRLKKNYDILMNYINM
jgi:acetoin utilization protein AcuB